MVTVLLASQPGVRIQAGGKRSFLFQGVETDPEAHPDSYSVGTGVIFVTGVEVGVKLPACEIDHLLTSSAEAKNEWSCTSAFPVWLHGMGRGKKNCTVYLYNNK
jgi:hypothetical protein